MSYALCFLSPPFVPDAPLSATCLPSFFGAYIIDKVDPANSGVVYPKYIDEPAPDTLSIPVPKPWPQDSSQAVGITSSFEPTPIPPSALPILKEPKLGVVIAILPLDHAS